MLTFHQTILTIGSVVLLIAFAASISIRNKYLSPKSLNFFFIVPLLAIILTINTIFFCVFRIYSAEIAGSLERILVAFDFLFWLYFFSSIRIRVVNKKRYEILLSVVLSIFFIVLSINLITNKFHHYTLCLFFIAEITLCSLYFKSLFSNPPEQLLTKNPVFLIVTGLLIKCAIVIPVSLASKIMFVSKNFKFYWIIFPITNIATLVMYVFFFYAFYYVRKEQQKVLGFKSEIQKI